MRIAISGSHGTGKSTLVAALSSELRTHLVVPEPYYNLVDDGYTFEYPPSLEDFVVQLEYSMSSINVNSSADTLFDRCPADYLAYCASFGVEGKEAIAKSYAAAAEALSGLDLVVFVPIENPDRIDIGDAEGRKLRRRTDAQLRKILIEDVWGLSLNVLEVHGTVQERVAQIMLRMKRPITTTSSGPLL